MYFANQWIVGGNIDVLKGYEPYEKLSQYFLMRKFLLCFICFCNVTGLSARQHDSYNVLSNGLNELIITDQFAFSEKQGRTTFQTLLDHPDRLELRTGKYLNNGVFNRNHWIKFNLVNQSDASEFVFEFGNNYADSIDVFVVKKGSLIHQFPQKGRYNSNDEPSDFLTNKYGRYYPFSLLPADTVSVYIHASVHDGPFRVINRIFSKKGYGERKKQIRFKTTYLLLLLGFVSLVLIFSLSMFLFTLRRLYLYYFGFVASVIINIICVNHLVSPITIEKYLFLGNNYTEMSSYLQVFFILLYANHFLPIKEKYPKVYRLFKTLAIINIAVFIAGLYLRNYDFYYAFSFYFSKVILAISTLLVPGFAVYLTVRRSLMALYFTVAYAPLVGFAVYIIFQSVNIVSFSNPISWELITFFEIVVLSTAMVHQYFILIKKSSRYQQIIIEQKEKSIEDIIETQDKERARIARDIHDGVLQKLGILVLKSKNIREGQLGKMDNGMDDLVLDLESSTKELREISHTIMPKALEENSSIKEAVSNLLLDSFSVAGIKYEFEHFNLNDAYSDKITSTVFRVLQELVNNIIKHSKANHVNVQLFMVEDQIILVVNDNGTGMSPNTTKTGIGLSNIQSRVEALDGAVNIETNLGNGTSTTIKIPVIQHGKN